MKESTLYDLKRYLQTDEGIEEVLALSDNLRSLVGTRENFLSVCGMAETELQQHRGYLELPYRTLRIFQPVIGLLPPGHDAGHLLRDTLNGVTIAGLAPQSAFKADVIAGVIAASLHDIGNLLVRRYQDKNTAVGHAEAGAWLIFTQTKDVLDIHLRQLTAYAVLAHTHLTKAVPVKFPGRYVRQPLWDDLWEENGLWYGLAPRITRMSDRLDTNALTQTWRHMLSRCDRNEEGGADLSGFEWVKLNKASFDMVFHPYIRPEGGNPPTTFEHVLRYKSSNWGKSPYSRDDHVFAGFDELLRGRYDGFDRAVSAMDNQDGGMLNLDRIKTFLAWQSRSDEQSLNPVMAEFINTMKSLPQEEAGRWGKFFFQSRAEYESILAGYGELMTKSLFPDTARLAYSLLTGASDPLDI